jgi:hypothetical protein
LAIPPDGYYLFSILIIILQYNYVVDVVHFLEMWSILKNGPRLFVVIEIEKCDRCGPFFIVTTDRQEKGKQEENTHITATVITFLSAKMHHIAHTSLIL